MGVWQVNLNLEMLNQRSRGTLAEYLGIVFTAFDANSLTATMPIEEHHKQPIGIMHGGATCALAETVGSTGANCCVDLSKRYCVGLDININHIRAVKSGIVIAVTRPLHLGKRTQVWGIEIHNEENQLVSVSRITMAVLEREKN